MHGHTLIHTNSYTHHTDSADWQHIFFAVGLFNDEILGSALRVKPDNLLYASKNSPYTNITGLGEMLHTIVLKKKKNNNN